MADMTIRTLSFYITLAAGTILIALGLLMADRASAQDTCGAARLAPVASGQVVQAFGDYDSAGLKSRGVDILTAARASVSAPAAGVVEYAGAVPNMGQVVIINIGSDHRVILTGLVTTTVKAGQHVVTYGTVGTMPDTAPSAMLYMELRCGEEPVDPEQATLIAMR